MEGLSLIKGRVIAGAVSTSNQRVLFGYELAEEVFEVAVEVLFEAILYSLGALRAVELFTRGFGRHLLPFLGGGRMSQVCGG